jgi:hypothetical protein
MTELNVLNPVAELDNLPTPRAPRAQSLTGAKVGLWWNKKIGGEVALEWLGEALEEEFGTTTGKYYDSFPAHPGLTDKAHAEVEVVIGATADCGSCTSWLVHDLVEIERKGTPTVVLVAADFVEDARQTAFTLGLGDLAIVEMPRGLTNLTPPEIVEIARDIKDRVVTGLTSEDYRDMGGAVLPQPTPERFAYAADDVLEAVAQFQADFLDRQLGDGFPLVPPTRQAVDAMLTGTSWPADKVVAVLEPAFGRATVEKIAINAVMAGCKPQHLPVVLAAVEAIADDPFCLRSTAMSTGPHAPLLVVNGPIVERIGINSGRGALGPSAASAVNVVLGRALRLVMVNCGYAYLGLFDLDTIGAPRKFSFCIAENEAASPFEPFHVERGFRADDSCVSVISVESETEVQDMANFEVEALLRTYAGTAGTSGAASVQHTYLELNTGRHKEQNVMLVSPEHAKVIADGGWTKQQAIEFVYRESFREARWVLNAVKTQAMRPEKRWAAELDPDTRIPTIDGPESLHLVVVGGAGGKGQFLTGISVPVTKSIETYLP